MSGSWRATYRLQLHAGFPLSAAQRVLRYLAELGISHVYLSPCLQAVPGSQHGYDVADPSKISEDLGGEAAWSDFVAGGAQIGAANPARHRAESHVRLAPQPVVGRCAGARAVQLVREFFDIRNPHGQAVLRASVLARQTLWRGFGSR